MMCIVGLTGQSGAGKTTISNAFADSGFSVINCDLVARQVTEKASPCVAQIAKAFGTAVLFSDGSLNRKALGAIVFSDKEKLELLNYIIFPHITQEIRKEIKRLQKQNITFVLLDAPTLFESNANLLCDKIVGVVAEQPIRKQRIMLRDTLSQQEAENRMNSQLSEEYFREHCDFIIENSGDIPQMEQLLKQVIQQIKQGA